MNPLSAIFRSIAPTAGAVPYSFRQDGLIHFLEGRRGRGKSYALNALILWCIENRVPVWTNTLSTDYYKMALIAYRGGHYSSITAALEWIQENVKFLRAWDDLLTVYGGVIILDEVTRLFEGRPGFAAQKTPAVVYEFFQQSRKVYVTLWLAGHSLEWIDKKVGQLVDIMWITRKVGHKRLKAPDGTPLPVRFFLYGTDPGGAGRTEQVRRNMANQVVKLPFRREIATAYNSWELIRLIAGDVSFSTVADIERYHVQRGRLIEPDPAGSIARHLERLKGGQLERTIFQPNQAAA